MENVCIICGSVIPEGRQVCKNCEEKTMNGEGYKDPAAEKAIRNVERSRKVPKHIRSVYRMLNAAAGVSGLEILGLRDKENGKEYIWKRK